MIALLQYWFLSALLLGAVAWCAEAFLRSRARQSRWVWAAAGGFTLAAPVLRGFWGPASDAATATAESTGVLALPASDLLATLPAASGGPSLDVLVGLAWIVVSFAALAVGWSALARLRTDASGWHSAVVQGEDVLIAPDFGPAVVGVLRPRIVLPETLPDCSEAEIGMVLAHENEHIRTRDPLLLRLALFAAALMPWNLAFLWQMSRLRQAVEQDCDLRVVDAGVAPRSYGTLLLKMASRSTLQPRWMAAAALAENRSGVAERLRLLRDRSGQSRTSVTALLIIAGAAALGVWLGVPSPVHFGGDDTAVRIEVQTAPKVDVAVDVDPVLAPEAPRVEVVVPAPKVRMRYSDGQWNDETPQSVELRKLRELEAALSSQLSTIREQGGADAEDAKLMEYIDQRMQEVEAAKEKLSGTVVRLRTDQADRTLTGNVIRLRGSDETDGDAERPLIYVDGVRFNGDMGELDPDDVDRVEVIKGDAARAQFGEDAANGVVQIYLKEGVKRPGGS